MGAYFAGKKISTQYDTGWVDASKYITSKFQIYPGSNISYRRVGSVVYFRGSLSPKTDITFSDATVGISILSGLPFAFSWGQSQLCMGTNGAYWSAGADGSNITLSRYMYPKTSLEPSTCKAGYLLTLGGTAFLLA